MYKPSTAQLIDRGKNNIPLAGFLIFLLVLLMMPPPIEHFLNKYRAVEGHPWEAISAQINGHYNWKNYPSESHDSKLTFRLAPAAIGKLWPTYDMYSQVLFLYVVQLLMGFAFTFFLLNWFYTLSGNFLFAFMSALGFLLTHIGSSFTYDLSFFFDGFAFFFLGWALFSKSLLYYTAGICASLWTDERAILGIAGVLLFKFLTSGYPNNLKGLLFNRHSLATYGSVLAYVLTRVLLSKYANMDIPLGDSAKVGVGEMLTQINLMPLAWILTFKLYWFYLAPLIAYLWKRFLMLAVAVSLFIAAAMLSTGMVIDIMRSTSYIFPFVICGIYCAYQLWPAEKNLRLAKWHALWSIVIPNYRNFTLFYLILPLPFRLLKVFF